MFEMNNNVITSCPILSIVKLDPSMYFDVWQNSLDDNNRRFVPDEVFETLEETKEVVDSLIECYNSSDGPFIYPVIREEDHANLGYVQLVKIEEGWEIGYHIAQKYNGKGYATTAVRLFLDYLKEHTEIKEIYGICLADNLASKRVLEKCGFSIYFIGQGDYQGQKRQIVKSLKKLR